MKRNAINALVLAFYVFYSIFPLLYCVGICPTDDQSLSSLSTRLTAAGHSSAPQDLLKTDSDVKDVSSEPVSLVLLKKKRAIVLSFKEIIGKLPYRYAKFSEGTPSQLVTGFALSSDTDNPVCSKGYPFYHSGMSPPPSDRVSPSTVLA